MHMPAYLDDPRTRERTRARAESTYYYS